MLEKAANTGLVKGLLSDFERGHPFFTVYVDYKMLFSSTGSQYFNSMKGILMWYVQILGMSELMPLNLGVDEFHIINHIFNCSVGCFRLKYLGRLLHYEHLSREDIPPLVYKIMRKIAAWIGKLLSLAIKALLIKMCLASILLYLPLY